MYKLHVRQANEKLIGLVILLAGRGQSAEGILTLYDKFSNLNQFSLISIEPIKEWYPVPRGAKNQAESLLGLRSSVLKMNDFIAKLEKRFEIERSKITLAGFSAGAVMSIQIAAHSDRSFGAVVVHNGTILNPVDLPESNDQTKYLIFHNEDDNCFSWQERYLPMKTVFIEKDYNLKFFEKQVGGHSMSVEDIKKAGAWLKNIF